MLRGRDPETAAASAYALMDTEGMDWLCVQEARGYVKALKRLAGSRFHVIEFMHQVAGADIETAILVRAEVSHGRGYLVRVTRSGWITVRGGHTGPKYLPTVRIHGDLRILGVHLAPSTRFRGGRLLGPVLRVLSVRQSAIRLVRYANRHPGPLVMIGDWNNTPQDRGRYSPHWIARKAGMVVVGPGVGTHGDEIDFALVRGAHARAFLLGKHNSDHHAVGLAVRP